MAQIDNLKFIITLFGDTRNMSNSAIEEAV